MPKSSSFIGLKFGRLKIIAVTDSIMPSGRRRQRFVCLCDCGNTSYPLTFRVLSGMTKSCGCYQKEAVAKRVYKHGHCTGTRETKTYRAWCGMKRRCLSRNCKSFPYYGGRGITVCFRWLSFENFIADMGQAPAGHSLDRIDNNKGYSPENCRWATPRIQSVNRRRTRFYTVDGITACMKDLCDIYQISPRTAIHRMKAGWSAQDAFGIAPSQHCRWTPEQRIRMWKLCCNSEIIQEEYGSGI